MRLDGGNGFGGAVITPYFDSLLVKVTTWGGTFHESILRMDRALREFRVRGVKTNIPFLENLLSHPTFAAGEATTTFIDNTPELFHFRPRRDRATKILSYLGDVIINGRAGSEGEGRSEARAARTDRSPVSAGSRPPPGSRNKLLELGPEKFAEWVRKQKRLMFTDTTMRDAHQSLLATRVRTYDLLAVADAVAHLDAGAVQPGNVGRRHVRHGHALSFRKIRGTASTSFGRRVPNILFQMLLRASNAVGYTNYPDNVVQEFVKEAAGHGIDVFRIFDSLNWVENMKVAVEAVRDKTDAICEAAICYTGDILDPKRTKYSLKYYVGMAKELVKMGTHILAIKDMAGLCKPYAAHALVKALRDEVDVPIHFHTHDTSGINAASVPARSDAGVDIVDGALAAMSGMTSQPNMNSLVAALANTPRETGLNLESLNRLSNYWEAVREQYYPFEEGMKAGTAEVYHHEMPGGQYTNLRQQAKSLGLEGRWEEIADTYAEVNKLFGDIVKVTPSSKVVGDLALFMVTNGLSAMDVLAPNQKLNFPRSVVEMMQGMLGPSRRAAGPKCSRRIILDTAGGSRSRAGLARSCPRRILRRAKES